jgi:hypothetical protein
MGYPKIQKEDLPLLAFPVRAYMTAAFGIQMGCRLSEFGVKDFL